MEANQSQRRTKAAVENDPKSPTISPYRPLAQDVDCTRLVEIEPARHESDDPVCSLIHANFGDKPKYEALSYMWGEDREKETIIVDGMQLSVTTNLWDALFYLRRHRPSCTRFWIDALCINQSDIPERNRQLRMMRHIYSRASLVVVWLGKKYAAYQEKIPSLSALEAFRSQDANPSASLPLKADLQASQQPETDNQEKNMAKELCSDGYWDRLWIIQELTQARGYDRIRILVCFGNMMGFKWTAFTHFVTQSGCAGEGFSRLNRQIEDKYTSGHTLRKLLAEHRAAKCKEPRDKIYGLISLAADARGFPMDYSKSLFDIWTDTMEFMNIQQLLAEFDIVEVGSLVRFLLMGADCSPLKQVLPYVSGATSTLVDQRAINPKILELQGYVLGYVMSVGPSTTDVIGNLGKVDSWETSVRDNFRDDLGTAYRESDMLLESIIKTDDEALATRCFNQTSTVRWVGRFQENKIMTAYSSCLRTATAAASASLTSKEVHAADHPHLYQLDKPELAYFERLGGYRDKPQWKMGISSSHVRRGDIICRIRGIDKGVLIRVHEIDDWKATMQIIGTAMVAEEVATSASYLSQLWKEDEMKVKMDARTLFVLLPGNYQVE